MREAEKKKKNYFDPPMKNLPVTGICKNCRLLVGSLTYLTRCPHYFCIWHNKRMPLLQKKVQLRKNFCCWKKDCDCDKLGAFCHTFLTEFAPKILSFGRKLAWKISYSYSHSHLLREKNKLASTKCLNWKHCTIVYKPVKLK